MGGLEGGWSRSALLLIFPAGNRPFRDVHHIDPSHNPAYFPGRCESVHAPMEVPMRPTRATALMFAAVTLAATAGSPSPAAAFFFPIPLMLGSPRAVTVNPSRDPTGSTGRVYTVKPGKASTETRSRDEDSKSSKASTRTSSKGDDGKPSKASTRTSSKDDDGKSSSKSGKGAKSATKAEANANSGQGGRQTQRRWSVEHEPAASKSSGRASAGANSGTEGASLTDTNRNIGDFDENLGEARMDDSVQLPPK